MTPGLLLGLLLWALLLLLGWAVCRVADRGEREDAQRNRGRLLEEQVRADERAIADNLDV